MIESVTLNIDAVVYTRTTECLMMQCSWLSQTEEWTDRQNNVVAAIR